MQRSVNTFVFTILVFVVVLPTASNGAIMCSRCDELYPDFGDEWYECYSKCASPIVINLEPGPLKLTGTGDSVLFDIDADGQLESLCWTDPAFLAGFLTLDRDGNGQIDHGGELFGNHTPQPTTDTPNGFNALEMYDRPETGGNGDGWISAEDSIFPLLRIWVDGNHDGLSQASELTPLRAWGIRAISVSYVDTKRTDRYGNWLRWSSLVEFDNGRRLAATDVFFVLDN